MPFRELADAERHPHRRGYWLLYDGRGGVWRAHRQRDKRWIAVRTVQPYAPDGFADVITADKLTTIRRSLITTAMGYTAQLAERAKATTETQER